MKTMTWNQRELIKENMLLVEHFDIFLVKKKFKNTLCFCFAEWGKKDHIIQKLFVYVEFSSPQF